MKTCGVCRLSKPLSEFNKKGSGHQSKCRDCQKEWYKNYYSSSDVEKTRVLNNNRIVKEEIRSIIKDAKGVPCADCDVKYPYYVMDFDHREPSEKSFTIAGFSKYGISAVKSEISKCDVVCANCHRERTHGHRLDTDE